MSINRYKYKLPGKGLKYDFSDKADCIDNHIRYMLSRTQSMFEYKGLPDSIPQRELELMLQTNGTVCIANVDGVLYAFTGGLGGEPNVYYRPTIYTVANPALKLSKNYSINNDCVVMLNDSMYTGLLPLFSRYATAMTENELSMKLVTINTRTAAIISASDDRSLKSAEKYISDMEEGKQAIIGDSNILNEVSLRVQPYGSNAYTNSLLTLIENEQYLKASWYNEIGLNANWNAKREALGSNESALNNDMLLPLVDDMLRCRREGLEKVNNMFDTNIEVGLSSSWKDNQEELDAEQKIIEAEGGGQDDQTE